jgi:dolichyl-phosphate beta-glucosyltransferase
VTERPDISVVIPVFNAERFLAERLGALVRYLEESPFEHEIVAVDDGSKDSSGAILDGLASPRFVSIRSAENHGKFAAIRRGMATARGRCRIFTDADVPYRMNAILRAARLVNERGFHLLVGDRSLPQSSYAETLGPIRRVATLAFTTAVRLFVTSGLGDTQCGFKAVRGDVADAIFPLMREDGFAGDVELLYIALKHNLEIKRIPVELGFAGHSTVRPLVHGAAMLRSLFAIRQRYRSGAYESPILSRLGSTD